MKNIVQFNFLLIVILAIVVLIPNNSFSQNNLPNIFQTTKVAKTVLREFPLFDGKEICVIPRNENIELLEYLENDYWKVKYLDYIGYVNGVFIEQTPEFIKLKEICIKNIAKAKEFELKKIQEEKALETERIKQIENEKKLAKQKQLKIDAEIHRKLEEENIRQTLENLEKRRNEEGFYKKYPEEDKVIGGVYFGMTNYTAEIKIKEFKEISAIKDKYVPLLNYYFIGNYQCIFIDGEYFDNILYLVKFTGSPIDWRYFDTEVPEAVKSIESILKTKYGNPLVNNKIEPRYFYKTGYSHLVRKWVIKNKIIEIRLVDDNTYYKVNLIFKRSDIENKIKLIEKKEQNEVNNKANKLL